MVNQDLPIHAPAESNVSDFVDGAHFAAELADNAVMRKFPADHGIDKNGACRTCIVRGGLFDTFAKTRQGG